VRCLARSVNSSSILFDPVRSECPVVEVGTTLSLTHSGRSSRDRPDVTGHLGRDRGKDIVDDPRQVTTRGR